MEQFKTTNLGIKVLKISKALEPSLIIKKQVRFPKSKKKRIRKKWAKRDCNYKTYHNAIHDKINKILYLTEESYNNIELSKLTKSDIKNKIRGNHSHLMHF